MRNAAHLLGELEGEAAVQLREGGCQIEFGQRLADAVAAAHAERHEARWRAPVHLRRSLGILHTVLCRGHHALMNTLICFLVRSFNSAFEPLYHGH